jgi:hypothetical protein
MMPEETQDEGLPFRPDFAARVLDRADDIVARRRSTRWTVGSGAVAAALVVFVMWRAQPSPDPEPVPQQIAGSEMSTLYAARVAEMGPLDFLFPDAAPLARFSQRYAGSGDATGDEAVLFPDAAAEIDGS